MGRRSRHALAAGTARWKGNAPLRILVGPYVHACHCEYMQGAFDDYDTITFGSWEGADVVIDGFCSMDDVLARLPRGWQPDLMLLWRPEYTLLPSGLERVDFPVAMLISDWYVAFTDCLEAARFVNVVVTGTRGERVYRTAGFDHVIAMPMLGYEEGLDGAFATEQRDIDVFCAGNPNWSVHREREQVNAELMALPESVNFVHAPFVSRAEYNRYLGRSKIFVNQTVIGEINMKVYEATAAEVCLFVEEDNLDVRDHLVPDESVVLFNRGNLREKILHYLEHDEERRAIARAGREAMQARSYRANMRDIVEALRQEGREALLTRGREIRRTSREVAAVHHAGYSLRRPHLDPFGAIDLARSVPAIPRSRQRFLELLAQYAANARVKSKSFEGPVPSKVWDLDAVVDGFQALWQDEADDLPVNLAWSQIAPTRARPEAALAAFDRVLDQLERTRRIPLDPTAIYVLPEKRRFVFERLAWEQVERSVPPDDVLRAYLLEFVHGTHADFLRGRGERLRALEAMRRAVAAHPEGEYSRPMLAQDLRELGQYDEAVAVLEHHLGRRPLDLRSRVSLIDLELRRGHIDASLEHLDALERIARVFSDLEWIERAERLRRGLQASLTHIASG